MEKATFKTIFINNYEIADRVSKLFLEYGGVDKVTSFDINYYGDWCKGWYKIVLRKTNSEMDKIAKDLGLKKTKKNNKLCWIFK